MDEGMGGVCFLVEASCSEFITRVLTILALGAVCLGCCDAGDICFLEAEGMAGWSHLGWGTANSPFMVWRWWMGGF